ncbi:MAG: hypothetical protein LBI28_05065 [Treponema sp.]|jgi:uncharacterized protein YoxC|nr:hypothetical protein [Treponema sp.]
MNIFFIISIICLALCFLMFFYLKWYVKKRTSSSLLEEHRGEVNKLIADIDSVTDRDSQLVEDRINKLKNILHDVDARIAVYEKEIEDLSQKEANSQTDNKRKTETLYTSLGRGIRSALEIPQANPQKPQLEPPRPETIAPPVVEPVRAVSPPPLPPSKPPSKKQIRSFIDLLVNEGLSPQEIASRLDISIAEVTLAMNLRRQKRGGK